MTVIHGPFVSKWSQGTSTKPITASGAVNMGRVYARAAHATGDVRAHYEDLEFTSTGGGECFRVRSIVNKTGAAAGETINAAHFTTVINSAKTVAGAANALRVTLEVQGTTPSPGGTLAALQVATLIPTGWTDPGAAFIRFTDDGVGVLSQLFKLPHAPAVHDLTTLFVSSADKTATHMIRITDSAGTVYWLLATTNAPS